MFCIGAVHVLQKLESGICISRSGEELPALTRGKVAAVLADLAQVASLYACASVVCVGAFVWLCLDSLGICFKALLFTRTCRFMHAAMCLQVGTEFNSKTMKAGCFKCETPVAKYGDPDCPCSSVDNARSSVLWYADHELARRLVTKKASSGVLSPDENKALKAAEKGSNVIGGSRKFIENPCISPQLVTHSAYTEDELHLLGQGQTVFLHHYLMHSLSNEGARVLDQSIATMRHGPGQQAAAGYCVSPGQMKGSCRKYAAACAVPFALHAVIAFHHWTLAQTGGGRKKSLFSEANIKQALGINKTASLDIDRWQANFLEAVCLLAKVVSLLSDPVADDTLLAVRMHAVQAFLTSAKSVFPFILKKWKSHRLSGAARDVFHGTLFDTATYAGENRYVRACAYLYLWKVG